MKLLHKIGIGFGVGCTGDFLGQKINNKSIDLRRTVLWGTGVAIMQVPLFHVWFGLLHKNGFTVTTGTISTRLLKGARVTAMESLSVGPAYLILINIYASLIINNGIQSESPIQTAVDNVQNRWFTSLKTAYCCVAPAQIISHAFVPPQYKVLYLNIVSALWNVILSGLMCDEPE